MFVETQINMHVSKRCVNGKHVTCLFFKTTRKNSQKNLPREICQHTRCLLHIPFKLHVIISLFIKVLFENASAFA